MKSNSDNRPRVVILGGGFGGLWCARRLRRAPVDVTLIDRQNHHLFQPLLYQVATASLSPGDISAPLRRILSRQRNAKVLLGDAIDVDLENRSVLFRDLDEVHFDYLVVATGATHSYFGNEEWKGRAPGLKTVSDAVEIRRRFLLAFEQAERIVDEEARAALLTFVIVGGGPTGVEMAGAMAEIAHRALPCDFRNINTRDAVIYLVEGRDRILSGYPDALSDRARRDLEELGVTVRLDSMVTSIDEAGVWIGDEQIKARSVVWAAGVKASSLGARLGVETGVETDKSGRVVVAPDLSIPGHPNVFVVGDLAKATDPESGAEVPGLAPAAMQMGKHAARQISRAAAGGAAITQRPAFRYLDKGMLATIGRARAVALVRKARFAGLFAWLLWLAVHITFLIGFRNRLIVLIQWAWAYITFQRGARLIVESPLSDADTAAIEPPRGVEESNASAPETSA